MLRTLLFLAVILTAPLAQATEISPTSMPTFGYVAPAWLTPLSFSLGPAWQAFGLPEQGTTYYSSAAPIAGATTWDRFNPQSERYEAWYAAYVVTNFTFASEWNQPHLTVRDIPNSIQRLVTLMTVDQIVWLSAYGDPAPEATVVPGTLAVFGGDDRQFWMTYRMTTHSDVGGTIPTFPWYPPYAAVASTVKPYAPITADVLVHFTFDTTMQQLHVVFISGTEWKTLDEAIHTTPPQVTLEQFTMLAFTSFP